MRSLPPKLCPRSRHLQEMQYFTRFGYASCLENHLWCDRRPCRFVHLVFVLLGTGVWWHCAGIFYGLVWVVSVQQEFVLPECMDCTTEGFLRAYRPHSNMLCDCRPIRMFNRSRNLVSAGKKTHDFFTDPKNFKLGQQYLKIFIAYLQVLGSFIVFDVKWPLAVASCISWVHTVSSMIQIDILEIPGLACPWASYSYQTKFHVKMATPLIVSAMLAMPVGLHAHDTNIYLNIHTVMSIVCGQYHCSVYVQRVDMSV